MRRSMLFVPGNNPKMMTSCGFFGADAIIFDLEDAVSPDEKDAARRTLCTVCSIAAPNCNRTVDAIRSSSVSAGRTVTSTSADSAAPAEASFRITTKIPPCMFFNISCCLQQIFLD